MLNFKYKQLNITWRKLLCSNLQGKQFYLHRAFLKLVFPSETTKLILLVIITFLSGWQDGMNISLMLDETMPAKIDKKLLTDETFCWMNFQSFMASKHSDYVRCKSMSNFTRIQLVLTYCQLLTIFSCLAYTYITIYYHYMSKTESWVLMTITIW